MATWLPWTDQKVTLIFFICLWLSARMTSQTTLTLHSTVDYDSFGENKTVELKPGGKDIPVTEENKKEYIKYVPWRCFKRYYSHCAAKTLQMSTAVHFLSKIFFTQRYRNYWWTQFSSPFASFMASSLSPSSEDSTFEALELKLFGRNHLIYIACVYKSALGPLPQEYQRLPKSNW